MNLFRFLLLERDNLVVDFNGGERLDEQGRAAGGTAVNDPRDAAPVFCFHEDHVAAVALRDHLLLQVLAGVLASQVGLEGATEPPPLLAETITDSRQRRTG